MSRRRGFLLVMALLVSLLIAIIALSMLGMRRGGYMSSRSAVETAQARELARAGMEDIRIKLAKDPFFPTGVGDEQTIFSYSETVVRLDGVTAGSYQVIMDRSLRDSKQVLRLQSTGTLGEISPEATRYVIYAEYDLSGLPNSFKVWQEGVSPQLY